jgi:hypothetical protein
MLKIILGDVNSDFPRVKNFQFVILIYQRLMFQPFFFKIHFNWPNFEEHPAACVEKLGYTLQCGKLNRDNTSRRGYTPIRVHR